MNILLILSIIPSSLIFLMLVVGLLGLFVTSYVNKISFIKTYNTPLRMAAFVLVASSIYLSGALAYKDATDKQLSDLKLKLSQAETKSEKVNTEVVTKVAKETEVIRVKGDTIIHYIDREVPGATKECPVVPKEVITAHNMAVTLKTEDKKEDKK